MNPFQDNFLVTAKKFSSSYFCLLIFQSVFGNKWKNGKLIINLRYAIYLSFSLTNSRRVRGLNQEKGEVR